MGALIGLIAWALVTWAGYEIGKRKNRATAGLLLGLFLGLLGIIIIACMKPKKRELLIRRNSLPGYDPGYYDPGYYAPPAPPSNYYRAPASSFTPAPPTTKFPVVPQGTEEPDWTDLKP